jgi:hypothetical protein
MPGFCTPGLNAGRLIRATAGDKLAATRECEDASLFAIG